MEISQSHDLDERKTWAQRGEHEKKCHQCLNDDTVDEELKSRVYGTKQKLENHQNSTFHSPYKTWTRRMKDVHGSQSEDEVKWHCPYPHTNHHEGYNELLDMVEHVLNSTEAATSKEHEETKAADGWYDDDFFWELSAAEQPETTVLKKSNKLGLKIPAKGPATSIPHATYPNVYHGSRADADQPIDPAYVRHHFVHGDEISHEEQDKVLLDELQPYIDAGMITQGFGTLPNGEVHDRFKHVLVNGSETEHGS